MTAPGDAGAATSGQAGATELPHEVFPCVPVQSTEVVPARAALLTPDATPQRKLVLVRDIANAWKSPCASCHPGLLDGSATPWTDLTQPDPWYARRYRDEILARMMSDDTTYVMPPEAQFGKTWSQRSPDDPIVSLEKRLEAWYQTVDDSADGMSPRTDIFYEPGEPISISQYTMSRELGQELTNIGSCLPDKRSLGSDAEAAAQLDALFANAAELPSTLSETDLVSFDSEVLARTAVVSFAPAYPLYSDGAHKMRHVRVPRGGSIRFDAERQEFSIPDNTRFYKTFFKEVVQKDGSKAYRKLETRLIVARADGPAAHDGSHATHALYGTYAWNESETEAKLLRDRLRNGEPFQDRLITYITDEQKALDALTGSAPNKEETLFSAGASRTYAIPGAVRCVQCHMGSHTRSFVLGFTPLQINRRATGEGGTYEPASDDELAQLQRLIDYGVITGVSSADEIVPLEVSQGDRKPRNSYELAAQAYMLGNCAGCHNPRGYPTVENPALRDLLNYFPERACGGGIFQFPLERTSPRTRLPNGAGIPYISPSLIDYDPKDPEHSNVPPAAHILFEEGVAESDTTYYVAAPWRSLIYRNVDTPYMFTAGSTIYPHMPLNTPGFDVRAPKIMGDWMVSIPARSISQGPEHETPTQPYVEVRADDPQYAIAVGNARTRMSLYHDGGRASVDDFREAFGQQATPHLYTNFLNYRYAHYAPDTRDIVDHDLLHAGREGVRPADSSSLPSESASLRRSNSTASSLLKAAAQSNDGVPDRPHWVVADITDLPPPWAPRRNDWDAVLVPHTQKCEPLPGQNTCGRTLTTCDAWQLTHCDSWAPASYFKQLQNGVCTTRGTTACPCDAQQLNCDPKQRPAARVLKQLNGFKLTDEFRAFVRAPVPFGLWEEGPEHADCRFAEHGVRTVSDFSPEQKWPWMNALVDPKRHVYEQSYGAAVFGEICINCHGKKADSRGRQADNLMQLTGGATRVANLRDGLFGPVDAPAANRNRVFGGMFLRDSMTADDWAARYTAWMALGGTTAVIDPAILAVVGNNTVLGTDRPNKGAGTALDGNMLSIAKLLCEHTEGLLRPDYRSDTTIDAKRGVLAIRDAKRVSFAFIDSNGDGEMWRRLCDFDNPRPIMVLVPRSGELFPSDYVRAQGYPSGALVGDHTGALKNGLSVDNHLPWCVALDPNQADSQATLDAIVKDVRKGQALPLCPSETDWPRKRMSDDDLATWSTRGAINAGIAVFVYLNDRAVNALAGVTPQPTYDDCEHLGCSDDATAGTAASCVAQTMSRAAEFAGCE